MWHDRSSRRALFVVLAIAISIIMALLAFWAGHTVHRLQQNARRFQADGRFAQLALALRNYHLDQGAFPPLTLSKGKDPPYSWRVALLPYFEMADIYRRYDFSQPWDSAANRALAESMPDGEPGFFRSPDASTANPYCTHYLGISEHDLRWPGKKPLVSYLVTSGSSTFILVEAPESDIHWMEPRDTLETLAKE